MQIMFELRNRLLRYSMLIVFLGASAATADALSLEPVPETKSELRLSPRWLATGDEAKEAFQLLRNFESSQIDNRVALTRDRLSIQRVFNRKLDVRCDYGFELVEGDFQGYVNLEFTCQRLFEPVCENYFGADEVFQEEGVVIPWNPCGKAHAVGTVGVGTLAVRQAWGIDPVTFEIIDSNGQSYPSELEIDYSFGENELR